MLPGAEPGQEHDLAVRKFQRIVMVVRVVQVDLLEARDLLPQLLVGEEAECVLALDFALKHELRPRKEADGDIRLSDGRKAARDRVRELCRDEFVADLCRAVRYVLQAVVTHGRVLLLKPSFPEGYGNGNPCLPFPVPVRFLPSGRRRVSSPDGGDPFPRRKPAGTSLRLQAP
jgi:hypothetical protein